MHVCQVVTAGRSGCYWVSRYRVEVYADGQWKRYGEFEGNQDNSSQCIQNVDFDAEKVRIYPTQFENYIDFRADIVIGSSAQ